MPLTVNLPELSEADRELIKSKVKKLDDGSWVIYDRNGRELSLPEASVPGLLQALRADLAADQPDTD